MFYKNCLCGRFLYINLGRILVLQIFQYFVHKSFVNQKKTSHCFYDFIGFQFITHTVHDMILTPTAAFQYSLVQGLAKQFVKSTVEQYISPISQKQRWVTVKNSKIDACCICWLKQPIH